MPRLSGTASQVLRPQQATRMPGLSRPRTTITQGSGSGDETSQNQATKGTRPGRLTLAIYMGPLVVYDVWEQQRKALRPVTSPFCWIPEDDRGKVTQLTSDSPLKQRDFRYNPKMSR